ncbi:MAG: hypothetical protein KIT46_04550 [Anaerolineales bacterium]|nr:hypothetical protein [Anaerolineales bacterium]MCW5855300.1 hypothetical protein [Anaerolineales bacterium]
MGRTTQTVTDFIRQMESQLGPVGKALTPEERMILRRLFSGARRHIAAITMSGHLLPFEMVLLAMQLEQQKQLDELRAQLEGGE